MFFVINISLQELQYTLPFVFLCLFWYQEGNLVKRNGRRRKRKRKRRRRRRGYLFRHPADVLEVGVRGGGDRGPQVGVDVGQHVRE